MLAELEETQPENATVQQALGRRDYEEGAMDQAITHLEQAAKLDGKSAATYGWLSEALAQRERFEEAIAASEKAVSLDPWNALYQKALIERFISAKQYDKALAAMEHYVEAFPEDSGMRKALEFARK